MNKTTSHNMRILSIFSLSLGMLLTIHAPAAAQFDFSFGQRGGGSTQTFDQIRRVVRDAGNWSNQGQNFGNWTPKHNDHGNWQPQPYCPPQENPPIYRPVQPQPITPTPAPGNTEAPVDPEIAAARALVAKAKTHFQAARYAEARAELEKVIVLMPEDSDAYQFRSLTNFAEADFETAAGDAYDSFKLGNSWNWASIQDVYARDTETYKGHLRALENAVKTEPSVPRHFLLAYHYLVLNHLEHGEKHLQKVLELRPEEELTTQLLAVVQDMRAKQSTDTASK